jgi:hypothetical protein
VKGEKEPGHKSKELEKKNGTKRMEKGAKLSYSEGH